jgi:septal ring factor EnvC (AmiA/AmiB activator)
MTRRVAASCLLILAALANGAVAPSHGSSEAAGLRQVESEQHDRERDRDAARADAEAARMEAAQLDAQLAALNAGIENGDKTVGEKRLQLAAIHVRENALNARLGGEQERLTRLLGALELFRRDPPPALVTDPHDIRDAVRAAILIRAITPELERRARDLRAQALELSQLRRQAEMTSEALFTSESAVAERRAQLEALLAQKVALEHQAAAEAVAADQDVEALAARAQALRHPVAGVAPPPAPPPGLKPPPDPEHAGLFGRPKLFTSPLPGPPVQRFGDPEAGGRGRALGWTWRGSGGASVLAPATGVVEYAEPLKGWGLVMILRLGGGYRLVLAGLDSAVAATGQHVDQGQAIGRTARDGTSDLYFEIRKNNAVVDPAHWLVSPPGAPLKH